MLSVNVKFVYYKHFVCCARIALRVQKADKCIQQIKCEMKHKNAEIIITLALAQSFEVVKQMYTLYTLESIFHIHFIIITIRLTLAVTFDV